jgi:hypothetical protein
VAEEHELLAAVDLRDHGAGEIAHAHAVDLDGDVVECLVRDLALREQDLAEEIVGVRHRVVEAARRVGDRAHQRPVRAVAEQEAEDADVVLPRECVKLARVDDAGVGHAIGHEHDVRGAVGIEVAQAEIETLVQVGAVAGLELAHRLRPPCDALRRHRDPVARQRAGRTVEGDDAEAVFGAQAPERVRDAVREHPDLARHAARNVEHEDPVDAAREGGQVHARRDHEHERAFVRAGGAVRDHLDAAREAVGEAVVEHEVVRERGSAALEANAAVPVAEVLDDGRVLEAGHAHVGERPRAPESTLIERARDLRSEPEALREFVGAAVFERIEIATHPVSIATGW